jgi:AraC family transcriptional regulator of adaptative response / DNA-3-methyladenine glycosylase II
VHDDVDRCHRAVRSRDERFDRWFVIGVTVIGVTSTGIPCRPSCPAATPRRANVRFFPTAAAAQGAGFRACLRCRPDASPGSPQWRVRGDLAGRAMQLIADGVVDRDGVGGLAGRLGYGERHVHRQLVAELGSGPLALARAQRAQTARVLIETTDLPFAEVAFAAGLGSVRQFNDTVRVVFARRPTDRAVGRPAGRSRPAPSPRSACASPCARRSTARASWASSAPGRSTEWSRRTGGLPAHARAAPRPPDRRARAGGGVRRLHAAAVRPPGPRRPVQRCRRALDLDADPVAVDEALGRTRCCARSCAPGRACACPERSTPPSSCCGRSSASKCPWPPRARSRTGRAHARGPPRRPRRPGARSRRRRADPRSPARPRLPRPTWTASGSQGRARRPCGAAARALAAGELDPAPGTTGDRHALTSWREDTAAAPLTCAPGQPRPPGHAGGRCPPRPHAQGPPRRDPRRHPPRPNQQPPRAAALQGPPARPSLVRLPQPPISLIYSTPPASRSRCRAPPQVMRRTRESRLARESALGSARVREDIRCASPPVTVCVRHPTHVAVLRAVSERQHNRPDAVETVRAEIGVTSRQAVYDALAALTDEGVFRRIQPPSRRPAMKSRAGDTTTSSAEAAAGWSTSAVRSATRRAPRPMPHRPRSRAVTHWKETAREEKDRRV